MTPLYFIAATICQSPYRRSIQERDTNVQRQAKVHLAPVSARVDGNSLVFTADVAGFKEHGAILCYEVAAE